MPSSLARSRTWSWVGPTNVPPRSDTCPPPSSWFCTRPPTTPRASSTTTVFPALTRSRAAVSPAKPAPTTQTSAVRVRWRLAFALCFFASAAPGNAAVAPVAKAPATNRRRVVSVIHGPLSRKRHRCAYDPAAMQLPTLREDVAAAARRLAADGLVHATAGNVSARDGDLIAITPTGARLEELRADEVAVIDRSGAQVDGPLAPTSELELHIGVVERFGAGAVVHTHAPFATALSCVLDEVPLVHYEMLMLGGAVRVAPYATFGTPALAQGVLDALEGRTAALMANHGAVTWGVDLGGALAATEVLEWACAVYWRACQVGAPRVMGEGEQQAFVQALSQRGYGRRQAT